MKTTLVCRRIQRALTQVIIVPCVLTAMCSQFAGAQTATIHYTYDSLDRLTTIEYPDRVVHYGYDAAGNRLLISIEVVNARPMLSGITPSSAMVGTDQLYVSVRGAGFSERSVVLWNGDLRPTTFVSVSELSALLSQSDLATVGSATMTVSSPPPGGGVSSGVTFAIVSTCSVTLAPTSADVPAVGATGSVAIQAPAGACNWTGTTNQPWVTITSNASGAGPGALAYRVDQNPTSHLRIGHIAVADKSLTIAQAGTACRISTAVSSGSFDASGGAGVLSVTAVPDDCSWTALPSDAWISLVSPVSGTGSQEVAFSIAANTGTLARTGAIVVAGQSIPIAQNGKPVTLTVVLAGSGSGRVTSAPSGIDCGVSCTASFASGQVVALTPNAAEGSVFDAWSGDPDCADGSVMLASDTRCTATFKPILVTSPVPFITSVSPLSAPPGAPDTPIVVHGANLRSDTQLLVNGAVLPVVLNGTQLEAVLPAALLAAPRTLAVTLSNPGPGGGRSNNHCCCTCRRRIRKSCSRRLTAPRPARLQP